MRKGYRDKNMDKENWNIPFVKLKMDWLQSRPRVGAIPLVQSRMGAIL